MITTFICLSFHLIYSVTGVVYQKGNKYFTERSQYRAFSLHEH